MLTARKLFTEILNPETSLLEEIIWLRYVILVVVFFLKTLKDPQFSFQVT